MNTKPKARKFRFRRPDTAEAAAQAAEKAAGAALPFDASDDGFGARPFATARGDGQGAAENAAPSAQDELAAIRAENLTGRQLRNARRVANRYRIDAESDYDAVRQLRRRGIDPFQRSSLMQLVTGGRGEPEAEAAPRAEQGSGVMVQLPQRIAEPRREVGAPRAPDAGVSGIAEVLAIQRDIARRRRRRLALLVVRLMMFVLLPTLLAGYYYFRIATPMYATKSEFVIQQADTSGGAGLGSLFSGTAMATQHDSITVQGYLQSREAMLRLSEDHGFKAMFSDPAIDPIQRLPQGASNEEAYKTYTRHVRISYDPTEGVVKLEVSAPDPEASATFSRALIGYAEEQVDHLTQRLREDQMRGARDSYEEAELRMREAQARVVELQEKRGVLSAEAEVSSLMSQISSFETQLRQERLQLAELMANPRPNATRVSVTEANIARIEDMIAEMRAQMTASGADSASLARITSELMVAEADLQTRQMLLAQALQQLENARIEANRQVRYLSMGVRPVPPDEPTYPRAFENTLVAFLIFAGIYLMISLTAAVLREQVSA